MVRVGEVVHGIHVVLAGGSVIMAWVSQKGLSSCQDGHPRQKPWSSEILRYH